ncbi:hypothetical protein, partial [Cronobacter sakazakii]|uniref:hypothetical protein n=1 Tax=Cronobacter sakazakii TaxID=28141 RepID=UPI001F5127AA
TSKTPSYTKSVSWQHHRWGRLNDFDTRLIRFTLSVCGTPFDALLSRKCWSWQNGGRSQAGGAIVVL